MLLTVDAGNTHTGHGLFDGERLAAHFRISTRKDATADEAGALLCSLLARAGCTARQVSGMIVASVVPDVDRTLDRVGRECFGAPPLFVGPGVKTGLPLAIDNPHEVGADRIANAVAAVARCGAPVVVVDFGTATNFDVVGPSGGYLGGVIAPGVGVSAEALFERAARLTRVDVRRPPRVVGHNTVECLQSGLFHGYVAQVEGLLRRIHDELGVRAPVLATGGLASTFRDELPFVQEIDPHLTLDGLRRIWEKNRR